MRWSTAFAGAAVAAVASYDLLQRRHALLRNFPVIGHGRYLLESIGPELRQYITTGNDEERPFSRDQRRWVYASSKRVTNTFGFGTDNDIEFTDGYTIVKHRTFSQAKGAVPQQSGGRGVIGIVQARIGVPRRDMADAPEAVATGPQVGQQHRFDSAAEREVGTADDSCAGSRPAQRAAREHGRHAVDEFSFADRAHLRRTTLAVHRLRLHVNRRDDVVAAVHVGEEIVSEGARAGANPQVVVRIDDR